MRVLGTSPRALALRTALTPVAFALAAGSVAAQQGWTGSVEPISTPGQVSPAVVGVDASRTVIAVWRECATAVACQVVAARRTAAGWGAPRVVGGSIAGPPQLAVDADGAATVVWTEAILQQPAPIRLSRYLPERDSWTASLPLVSLGGGLVVTPATGGGTWVATVGGLDAAALTVARFDPATGRWLRRTALVVPGNAPALATSTAGDAVLLWHTNYGLAASLYRVRGDAWGAPTVLVTGPVFGGTIAMDAAGNAVATWGTVAGPGLFRVFAARMDGRSGRWALPGVVSALPTTTAPFPAVAVNAAGDAVIAWIGAPPGQGRRLHAAHGSVSASTWSVWGDADAAEGAAADVDADLGGNFVVTWAAGGAGTASVRCARYLARSGTWRVDDTVSPDGVDPASARAVIDAAGDVTVLWTPHVDGDSTVLARTWSAAPSAPVVTAVLPGTGTVRLTLTPPPTIDAVYDPLTYEYSLDDGATWTPRVPPSPWPDLDVDGLTDGRPVRVRVRAVNAAGPGLPSAVVRVTSGSPSAPLTVSVP